MDLMPGLVATETSMGFTRSLRMEGTYRDVHYVKEQVELLATQLKAFA